MIINPPYKIKETHDKIPPINTNIQNLEEYQKRDFSLGGYAPREGGARAGVRSSPRTSPRTPPRTPPGTPPRTSPRTPPQRPVISPIESRERRVRSLSRPRAQAPRRRRPSLSSTIARMPAASAAWLPRSPPRFGWRATPRPTIPPPSPPSSATSPRSPPRSPPPRPPPYKPSQELIDAISSEDEEAEQTAVLRQSGGNVRGRKKRHKYKKNKSKKRKSSKRKKNKSKRRKSSKRKKNKKKSSRRK